MTTIKWIPTVKQREALEVLTDKKTNMLLFGGGAGGAKSYLGCAWAIFLCMNYPGVRGVIARVRLTYLKDTTLNTFFEVCRDWNIRPYIDYSYNQQRNIIKFKNGSEILLKELYYQPRDPEFDSLGSLEITFAFVDEANQVVWRGIEVLQTRIRYKLDHYNLIPKILMTCNPAKNWTKKEFYDPWKEGNMEPHKMFIQALATDNPYISEHYINNLKRTKIQATKERLLHGNWDYDDDPACLFDYTDSWNLFTNTGTPGEKYIIVDAARMGGDKIVITYWEGLQCKKIIVKTKQKTDVTARQIRELAARKQVKASHILIDEGGVGGGVVDQVPGSQGFLSAEKAIKVKNNDNYLNLRAQCYFKLADIVEEGEMGITCDDPEIQKDIVEELSYIKAKDIDKDGKSAIIPKEQIKEELGRSPDFADTLMMRMKYWIKPIKKMSATTATTY